MRVGVRNHYSSLKWPIPKSQIVPLGLDGPLGRPTVAWQIAERI